MFGIGTPHAARINNPRDWAGVRFVDASKAST
jgi:hypothetical protein